MKAEPKLLSECGERYVIKDEPGDRYEVAIEPGEYLLVEFGATVGKAAAKFSHPNVAATARQMYNFRTYFASGAKRWYSKAGVSHYFVVPRSAVKLLPEEGMSYVRAEINGVKVSFNVSGGGGSGLWTDWLHTKTQVAVNHKVSDLRRVAEVAVRGTVLEPVAVKELEPGEAADWERLAAKAAPDVKKVIAEMVEKGLKPVVKLLPGYAEGEGVGVEVIRQRKKVYVGSAEVTYRIEETGALKRLVLEVGGLKRMAKLGQVGWAATAKANGLAA